LIEFNCKNCGRKFKVSERNAGKKGTCPQCKNPIVIPAPTKTMPADPSIIKFRCPNCNQKIGLKKEYAGRQVRCAKCKGSVLVPGGQEKPQAVKQHTDILRADYADQPETQSGPLEGLLDDAASLEALQQAEANAKAIGQPQMKEQEEEYKLAPADPPRVPQVDEFTAFQKPPKYTAERNRIKASMVGYILALVNFVITIVAGWLIISSVTS
jgi:DNA-directed RNA polymerase subunit RPC12/RpoP